MSSGAGGVRSSRPFRVADSSLTPTVPGETVPGETAPGESAPGTAIKRAQAGRIASKPTNIWSGDRRLKFGL